MHSSDVGDAIAFLLGLPTQDFEALTSPDKAPLMKRNLRAMFLRARLTEQEARTFRGVIKALTIGRGGRKKGDPV